MAEGFRWSELLTELRLALLSRPLQTAAVIAVSAIAGAGATALSLAETGAIHRDWDRMRDAGAFVEVAHSASAEGLPMRFCEELNRVDGILAAGAILSTSPVEFTALPGQRRELHRVSPAMPRLLWPGSTPPRAGLIAGARLAEQLGAVPGAPLEGRSPLIGDARAFPIESVAERPARRPGPDIGLTLVEHSPDRGVRECYVEYSPGARAEVRAAIGAIIPAEHPVSVSALLREGTERVRSPEEALAGRAGAVLALGCAAAVAMLACALWWARRAEVALYRALGLTATRLLCLYGVETLAVMMLPAALGALAAVGFDLVPHAPPALALNLAAADLARLLAVLALLPVAGLALTGRTPPGTVFRGG